MKKLFYLITCFIFLSAFSGCAKTTDTDNKNTNSTTTAAPEEEIKTSKVLLVTDLPNSNCPSYTFIDQEGEVYKTGTVYQNETITINHFKNGTYVLRSSARYIEGVYSNEITIDKDCTVTISAYGTYKIN